MCYTYINSTAKNCSAKQFLALLPQKDIAFMITTINYNMKHYDASPMATYQTRINGVNGMHTANVLDILAETHGNIERKLFADIMAGKSTALLHKIYQHQYGISAAMFDSIKVSVVGKIKAEKASQKHQIKLLRNRIKNAKHIIKTLSNQSDKTLQVHNKKRKLSILENKLNKLLDDKTKGIVRIAFGSKQLWRKQFDLESNDYSNHAEWLFDWRFTRNNEIFIMGSRTRNTGNLNCQATPDINGNLTLKLRLPYCLESEYGKYLIINNVNFNYGHDHILAALQNNDDYKAYAKVHGKAVKETDLGQPLTYRFTKDAKGWRVFVTTKQINVPIVTYKGLGTIGVDINEHHLAITEVDSCGNYLNTFSVPLNLYGKSTNQATDIINKAVIKVIDYAKSVKKPIVLEKLDFQTKKAKLEGESKKHKRMLSSFAYSKIITSLKPGI